MGKITRLTANNDVFKLKPVAQHDIYCINTMTITFDYMIYNSLYICKPRKCSRWPWTFYSTSVRQIINVITLICRACYVIHLIPTFSHCALNHNVWDHTQLTNQSKHKWKTDKVQQSEQHENTSYKVVYYVPLQPGTVMLNIYQLQRCSWDPEWFYIDIQILYKW